mmetsp:Transcript_2430/g.2983  ORF Transcript_2430/g.2983 Transcript_2430/m.2983 type:complete len:102 (-) Transcript_2430:338-643(-)
MITENLAIIAITIALPATEITRRTDIELQQVAEIGAGVEVEVQGEVQGDIAHQAGDLIRGRNQDIPAMSAGKNQDILAMIGGKNHMVILHAGEIEDQKPRE